MTATEMIIVLSNLTTAEHKAMQKALRVLMSVGIDQISALDTICIGLKNRKLRQTEYKIAAHK